MPWVHINQGITDSSSFMFFYEGQVSTMFHVPFSTIEEYNTRPRQSRHAVGIYLYYFTDMVHN